MVNNGGNTTETLQLNTICGTSCSYAPSRDPATTPLFLRRPSESARDILFSMVQLKHALIEVVELLRRERTLALGVFFFIAFFFFLSFPTSLIFFIFFSLIFAPPRGSSPLGQKKVPPANKWFA